MDDVIDAVAGIAPGSPLATLRRRREDFVRYSQGSHDVLLLTEEPGGLTRAERAAAALRAAEINQDAALSAHYRALLPTPGLSATPRLAALLDHVDLLARTPRAATPERLAALQQAGFSPRDIVVIAQLVAFVSYQVRVLAGLRLLQQEPGA